MFGYREEDVAPMCVGTAILSQLDCGSKMDLVMSPHY